MDFVEQLSVILHCKERFALARAAFCKILPPCGRCNGSGRHSFNQIHGSICYGCDGRGSVRPAKGQEAAVLVEAAKAAKDGRLEAYETWLQNTKRAKKASDLVMAAWQATGISSEYQWHKASHHEYHRAISEINKTMCDAYDSVKDIKADTVHLLDEALTSIASANMELQAYILENKQ